MLTDFHPKYIRIFPSTLSNPWPIELDWSVTFPPGGLAALYHRSGAV